LAVAAERGEGWARWLEALPRLGNELLAEWNLTPTGPLWHGYCSLVLAVITEDDTPAALKITYDGDIESRGEHLVLGRWQGRGAVRLLRASPAHRALLLERLSQETLKPLWDVAACEVVGALYERLHVPPMPQLPTVADYVTGWVAALAQDRAEVPIPRRYVDQAISLARDLSAEPPTAVIHCDLHYDNVLRGERYGEPAWLAIDPKPMNGWPAYECEPMVRNRYDEYGDAVRWGVRNRLGALIDAGGLDPDRARDWVIVRSIINAHWTFADALAASRQLTSAEQAHITGCIAVAKAVQD